MTASVLSAIAPTPPQGETMTSAAPLHGDTATGHRFSDLLARKLKTREDAAHDDAAAAAGTDANASTLGLPNTHDTAQSAAAHAALDAADLNAHIARQVNLLTQGAAQNDASSQALHAEATPAQSISPLDAGRSLRLASRTAHANAISRFQRADVDAGVDMDGFDTTDGPRSNTASHLTRNGKKTVAAASMTAQTPSASAHALRATPDAAGSMTNALSEHADARTLQAASPIASVDMSAHATAGHGDSLLGASANVAQSASGFAATPSNLSNILPTTEAGIAAPLHHPQWSQALGQHVLHLAQTDAQGPQTAELRLDPPELGPLRIAIALHQHVAHATFVSAHAPVRQAVENALPQLQEQLAQAGISLGQANVSDQGTAQQEFAAHDALPLRIDHPPPQTGPQTTHTAGTATRVHNPHALIDTFV